MSTYAIGDVHGCLDNLLYLLDDIKFDDSSDILWFTGDLVAKGNKSAEVLRFLKSLKSKPVVVLGNNDIALIANYYAPSIYSDEELINIINGNSDIDDLIDWLQSQKLMHYSKKLDSILVHAGIHPFWSRDEALMYAKEAENVISSKEFYLSGIFDRNNSVWSDSLVGFDRYRFIINSFSMMRFCYEDGRLDYKHKGEIGSQPEYLVPWYCVKKRKAIKEKIFFGHWASILGEIHPNHKNKLFALDTGCVYGNKLTAVRVEDLNIFYY